MIDSILIANRGEIAFRILSTCREMGIRSIAVYSDADRNTSLVAQADQAVRLGAAPPADSYLNLERLLEIAVETGAQAIHPGYGFLAENPAFSAGCREKGIIFIGPSPEVIKAMGDKAEAKRLMGKAGVPVVPGYQEALQDDSTLGREAEKLGYPLLIKAVAGGGGRGIRLVGEAGEFAEALASARREALSGFGDDRMLLEKFLSAPRHVEFQILADSQGQTIHLFERECSVQRRRQKIIEETPSPALTPALRSAMSEAAVQAAQAIGYEGAGTVEFLVEFLLEGAEDFYFLEMNTRIQVEHPITEMTLGLDLVKLQIEIASGEPLTISQQSLRPQGHALECRLNAEDPTRDFLPDTGRLGTFSFPAIPDCRVDTGFSKRYRVTSHYDSLLAKLVAWGQTREEALSKMRDLLAGSIITGPATNISFLQATLSSPEFKSGNYNTRFVEEREKELIEGINSPEILTDALLAASAIEALWKKEQALSSGDEDGPGVASLWQADIPWRASTGIQSTLSRVFSLNGETHQVEIKFPPPEGEGLFLEMTWQGRAYPANFLATGARKGILDPGGNRLAVSWAVEGDTRMIALRDTHLSLKVLLTGDVNDDTGISEALAQGSLSAPLPGRVVALPVRPGQVVAPGELLAVVEAMKMEHPLTAPFKGRVTAIHFQEGDLIEKGDLLLDLEPEK